MKELLGRIVTNLRFYGDPEDEPDMLRFTFDDGSELLYQVDGDCCSSSYFSDVIGLHWLKENGPIAAVDAIPGGSYDPNTYDSIQVYGWRLTTEHPYWGPVTSVISFRNRSNGYYGGSCSALNASSYSWMKPELWHEITADIIEGS
jgi:hypothetical protein